MTEQVPLPPLEIDLLLTTVDEALDLALANRPEDGAAELAYGLTRAETFLEAGEPFALELVERWRTALRNFCFKYRVRPPGPTL
jgi:hypothetical protein